jgi:hypothetical protein
MASSSTAGTVPKRFAKFEEKLWHASFASMNMAKAFIKRARFGPVEARHREFPLEQIEQTTRFLESNALIGKVVVNV